MMKDCYVSRTGRDAALIARCDPVIYEGGRYARALDQEQLQAYEQDGFLILPDVFDASEVGALREEAVALEHDPAVREGEEVIREPGGDALRSIFRVHELGRRLADNPDLRPTFLRVIHAARGASRALSFTAFPAVAHAALAGRPASNDFARRLRLTIAVARGKI